MAASGVVGLVSRRGVLTSAGVGSLGLAGAALIGCSASKEAAPVARGGAGTAAIATPSADKPKSGGIFKYAAPADVETLDRYKGSAPTGWSLPTYFTYSRLLKFESGSGGSAASGKIVGDLAKSFEQPDPQTVVIHLNPAAKFDQRAPTNGRQVNAEDVVQSWKRFAKEADSRTTLSNAANKNAGVVDIEAVDPQTVRVKMAFPDALVLPGLAGASTTIWVQPVEGIQGKVDLTKEMRGSGAFYLDSYQRAVGYTFKRNPNWHGGDGKPYLDQVNVPIIPERAQTEAQFRAKNLHALAVSQENIPTFAKELKDTRIVTSTPASGGPLLGLSWAPGQPWQDVRVRRALSMAIDRDSFVNVVFDPKRYADIGVKLDTFWNTPVSAGWGEYWLNPKGKDFGPAAQYLQRNVNEAKKLMDAAGYSAAKPLAFDVVFPGVYYGRDWPTRVEVFQTMAADVGMKITPASIDYTQYISGYWRGGAMFEGRTQKNAAQFPPGGGSSSSALDWLNSYFTPAGTNNAVAKAWPVLEEMLIKQRQVTDFQTQKQGLYEIQRYIVDNMVVVPVGPITQSVDLVWKQLHGPGDVQGWPGGFPAATEYSDYWLDGPIA